MTIVFYCILLLANFSSTLCSLGTILGSAFASSGVEHPATVTAVGALAILVALALNSFFPLRDHKPLRSCAILCAIGSVFSIALYALPFPSTLWYGAVFFKVAFQALLFAWLTGVMRDVFVNVARGLKISQVLTGVALAATMFLGPQITTRYGIKHIFSLDFVVSIFTFGGLLVLSAKITPKETPHASELKLGFPPEFWLSTVLVFALYCVAGAFHSMEVKMLQTITPNPNVITMVLVASGVGHAIGSILLPDKFVDANSYRVLAVSSVLTLISSIAYFYVTTVIAALVVALLFTVFNALIFLSIGFIVQRFSLRSQRSAGQLIFRSGAQIALVLASLLVFKTGNFSEVKIVFTRLGAIVLFGMILLIVATSKRKHRIPLRAVS